MVETVKVNLDRTLLLLKITGIVAGALIAAATVYGQIDARMDKYEIQQAVEKGVNQEKWKSLEKSLEQIGDDIKELKPKSHNANN